MGLRVSSLLGSTSIFRKSHEEPGSFSDIYSYITVFCHSSETNESFSRPICYNFKELKMFHVIFTLDYEIHGNGDGDPQNLLVEPTHRLIKLFDKYGAKLTIMADAAEIIQFERYDSLNHTSRYSSKQILDQLGSAVAANHDVQLHIHSGYVDSQIDAVKLHVKWDNYNLALLPANHIGQIVRNCKVYLETKLLPYNHEYRCIAFRAANWSMVPTTNIESALVENGIVYDSSVFKYGKRSNKVMFDYSDAYDALLPWLVDKTDVCKRDDDGKLWEVPIYCEKRHFINFITAIRIFRLIRARFHKHEKIDLYTKYGYTQPSNANPTKKKKSKIAKIIALFNKRMAWKLDFNQATGLQLIEALKRIKRDYSRYNSDLPIIFIGHSKSFIEMNERTLEPLLKYIADNPDTFCFSLFQDIKPLAIERLEGKK